MANSDKKTPAPAAAGAGAGADTPNHANIVPQAAAEVNPLPGYWAVIPASVRYDTQLKPSAKLLYGEISALTQAEGYCWASNDYFARLYGVSKDNIGRLIAQLESAGYITRENIRDEESGAITGRRIWLVHTPPCKNADTPLQKCSDPLCKKAEENNININNIPPISPKGDEKQPEPVDVLFERFWKRYPARTVDGAARKGSKQRAKKRWRSLKVSARLYTRIMDALAGYISSPEVQRGYAMDASRWLNERCWEDEVSPLDAGYTAAARSDVVRNDVPEELPGGFWDG